MAKVSKEIIKITTYEEDINTIKNVTTQAFLISGNILESIQLETKYKENEYKTFEEAVESDLGMKKAHAYRLINAAKEYKRLSPIGDKLPTTESQIRPLLTIEEDKRDIVWKKASKDGVPTAKHVKATILELYPLKNKKKVRRPTHPTEIPTEGGSDEPVIQKLDVPIVTPKVQDDIDKLKETCVRLRTRIGTLKQQLYDTAQEAEKYKKDYNFIMEEANKLEVKQKEEFNQLFQDFNRIYSMLSPLQKAKYNDEDSTLTNQQIVAKNNKAKEEKAIAQRKYFGVNGDGTPI